MALDKSALLELTEALSRADGGQLMRRLLHTILQTLIDAEAAEHIGADPHCGTWCGHRCAGGTREKFHRTLFSTPRTVMGRRAVHPTARLSLDVPAL
jgi:hypothetical protein